MKKTIMILGLIMFLVLAMPVHADESVIYDNWYFDTTPITVGLAMNSTYFWVADYYDNVNRYNSTGHYEDGFMVSNSISGITFNGTYLWVSHDYINDDIIMRFTPTGDYDNWNFTVEGQTGHAKDVHYNGTYFWVVSRDPNRVFRYNESGIYNDSYFNLTEMNTPTGIYFNETYFWLVEESNPNGAEAIMRYNSTGHYDNWYFNTSSEDLSPEGVAFNGTYFWVAGAENDKVYRYKFDTFSFINETSYSETEHEGNASNFTITFNNDADISSIIAYLIYNGTNHSYDTSTNTTENWTISKNIYIPLIETNNTNTTHYWNYKVTYVNASYEVANSDTNQQTVYWSYFFDTAQGNITVGLEEDPIRFSTNLTSYNDIATQSNTSAIFNNVIYTPTISGSEWYYDINLPLLNETTMLNFSFSINLQIGSSTTIRESGEGNVTVLAVLFNSTTASGFCEVAQFDYWNEENTTQELNATMEMVLRTWKSNPDVYKEFNFTYASNTSHYLYISPCNTSRYVFTIQDYMNEADGYPERHYFLLGTELSNVSQTFDLYLLNSTYADIIGVSVHDILGLGVPDIVVSAQRFYTGENLYRTVAMGLTDSDGNTVMRLRKCTGEDDIWYRFMLYQDYELGKTFNNTCIIADTLILSLGMGSLTEYWEYFNEISYTCDYNNVTRLLLCEYIDTSGKLEQANLYVRQIETVGYTEICNETSTSSSDSLSCDLSGEDASGTFGWRLDFTYEKTVYTVAKGIIENLTDIFGESGIFAGFLLFLAMVGIGAFRPQAMLVLGIIGIIIAYITGLIAMGIVGIIGLIICFILFIIKSGEE